MRYKIPRHVDYKAKIVGPATFSQLLYMGVAGLVILFFYFVLGDSPLFWPMALIFGGGGVALAFVQVSGQPLPEYLKKMFIFSTSSREYIWEKKIVPMEAAIPKRKSPSSEKKEDENKKDNDIHKRNKGGRLGNIASQIETF